MVETATADGCRATDAASAEASIQPDGFSRESLRERRIHGSCSVRWSTLLREPGVSPVVMVLAGPRWEVSESKAQGSYKPPDLSVGFMTRPLPTLPLPCALSPADSQRDPHVTGAPRADAAAGVSAITIAEAPHAQRVTGGATAANHRSILGATDNGRPSTIDQLEVRGAEKRRGAAAGALALA